MLSINCKGKLLTFDRPKIMGILNITPNSFYDGGKHNEVSSALNQMEKLLLEGADIIDIGAYSTQPKAPFVSEEEELNRMISFIKEAVKQFPEAILSIDTFRSEVAKQALTEGAHIINDVSGGKLDDKMFETVGGFQAPYILMHMKGTPQTMQQFTDYKDVVKEMMYYFSEQIQLAKQAGIKDVIVDPGFGFSKTLDQNYEVLSKLELFQLLEVPVLSALSRKSMIYRFFDYSPQEALNGTTVLNTISLIKGAQLLRVHDVKKAVECVKLYLKTYEK